MVDPFWQRDGITLYCGDALRVLQALPDASVHCCGTSPPYFALRDYGHDGQIGLEDTPQEYIARLVEVFDQVWRVLRPDGVLWLNLGDVYCANQPGGRTGSTLAKGGKQTLHSRKGRSKRTGAASANIKPKDLMGLPWRLAFALQDRGWYLRSEVIWERPNALPESVRDRPTKAHETVFLLTRNDRYFYDPDGWREPVSAESVARAKRNRFGGKYQDTTGEEHGAIKRGANYGPDGDIEKIAPSGGRNIRSVWSIPTEPCPYPHFAVFPRELAARFILLGTSEKGCCAECGAPWSRVVGHPCAECGESVPAHAKECPECGHRNANWREHRGGDVSQRVDPHLPGRHAPRLPGGFTNTQLALDWEPTCMCRVLRCSACGWNETVRGMKGTTLLVGVCPDCDRKLQSELPAVEPCTVLDPFVGSGTTLLVAEELLRRGVGIEINPDNCEIVKKRCGPQRSLFVSAPSKP